MKKIILIITITVINNLYMSQNIVPMATYTTNDLKSGNYIKDINGMLDNFTGTWKYINGNEEFIVKIDKVLQYNSSGLTAYYEDVLFGGYKYTKNGVIVVNKLNFTYDINDFQNCAIIIGGKTPNEAPFKVSLVGSDYVNNKMIHIYLEYLPTANQLKWDLSAIEQINIGTTSNPAVSTSLQGIGIPNNIILDKQ